jgi:hypothetical protein
VLTSVIVKKIAHSLSVSYRVEANGPNAPLTAVVLAAFSGYGVALYSIHDNPGFGNRSSQDVTSDRQNRNSPKATADETGSSETGASVTGPIHKQNDQEAVPATSTTIEDDMEVDPVALGTTAQPAQVASRQYHLSDFLLDKNQDHPLSPFRSADGTVETESLPEDTPSQSDDEDGSHDDDDDMQADAVGLNGPDQSGWAGVPIVYPRSTYKGARNVETVKDGKSVLANNRILHVELLFWDSMLVKFHLAGHEATKSVAVPTTATGSCGTRLRAD